jgi:ubiquitin C-terminal hydrolase
MARALFASMGLSPEKTSYGNLNNLPPHPRGHQDLEMKTTESQVNDTRIIRRAPKSSHLATVPGACGLLNIGNTCFMSVGLQCLSHTPLFRSYFLSGRYLDEINRENPLGTGGKLVSEFAQLLRMIWSGSNVHISPFKFKKVLEKCKPIFAGHDQQDAQEFLSEMLDSLHEDVNRVIVKPYVKAPEDHVWDKLTLTQQAEDAWQRHLQRNRSVLVDLFQGQLMSEVTCQSCKRNSRTFDPFMLLSVPLPKHSEKQISVYLIRKMPHFPRHPTSAYTDTDYDPSSFITCLRSNPSLPSLIFSSGTAHLSFATA